MLNPQELHIPLVTGLNEGVDEKIAPEGTLAVARNVRVDRAGRLVKRDGYSRIAVTERGAGVMVHGQSVLIGDQAEVVRVSPGSAAAAQVAGWMPMANVTRDFLPTDADVVSDLGEWWLNATEGYGLVAWAGTDGSVQCVIYDAITGNHIRSAELLSDAHSAEDVRVVVAVYGIYVVAAEYSEPDIDGYLDPDFYATYIPYAGLQAAAGLSESTIQMTSLSFEKRDGASPVPVPVNADPKINVRWTNWSVCAVSGELILAWAGDPQGNVSSFYPSYPPLVEHNRYDLEYGIHENIALCSGTSVDHFWLAYVEEKPTPSTPSPLLVTRYERDISAPNFIYPSDPPPGTPDRLRIDPGVITHLGGVGTMSTASTWFWSEAEFDDNVEWSTMYWRDALRSTTAPDFLAHSRPNLVPISKPFVLDFPPGTEVNVFCHAARAVTDCTPASDDVPVRFFAESAQWAYSDVLVSVRGAYTGATAPANAEELTVSAMVSTGVSSRDINYYEIPRSVSLSPDREYAAWAWYDLSLGYQTFAPYKLDPEAGAQGGYVFEGNVTRYRASLGNYSYVSVSGQTMSSSGIAKVWGKTLGTEVIMPHPMRIMGFGAFDGVGSMTPSARYTYAAVWEWYSGGVRYQSEPSVAQSIDLGASAGSVAVWVETPTLGEIATRGAKLVLYRSVADGGAEGVLYRLRDSVASNVEANLYVDTPYYVLNDHEADTQIQPNEVIYTVSQLANNAVPGGPCVANHKGRVWVGGGLDPWRLYYSQPSRQGLPPRWNLAMYMDIPAELSVRALASAGDVLAVFGEDAIYIILGDGPNELGFPADGFRAQLLVSGVGTVDQRSVVETPSGVFFASGAGLRLLTRGLEVVPVGESVKDSFSAGECTAAFYNQANEETRFCIADNDVVVFNHTSNAWTTERLAGAGTGSIIGGGVAGGLIAFADDGGSVYVQTPGAYVDEGPDGVGDVYMTVESAWLKMGAFTGFKRLWWLHLLGEYVDPHSIEVDMTSGYTDGSTLKTTHAWTDADLAALDHYELRVHLLYQRADAFKVTVREGPSGVEDVGAGFQLNAFGLLFGVRGTLAKLPAGASK